MTSARPVMALTTQQMQCQPQSFAAKCLAKDEASAVQAVMQTKAISDRTVRLISLVLILVVIGGLCGAIILEQTTVIANQHSGKQRSELIIRKLDTIQRDLNQH
jgi:hypothetical protein